MTALFQRNYADNRQPAERIILGLFIITFAIMTVYAYGQWMLLYSGFMQMPASNTWQLTLPQQSETLGHLCTAGLFACLSVNAFHRQTSTKSAIYLVLMVGMFILLYARLIAFHA